MRIVLASKSPRRQKMFQDLKIPFEQISNDCDETIDNTLSPDIIVEELAKRKAESTFSFLENKKDTLVIGADTIVFGNSKVLGKPKDDTDAFLMLKSLSGTTHFVYSGVCAIYNGKVCSGYEKTDVKFRILSDREIEKYIKTGEHRDKAGSYGIQENGGYFVESVNGDINNVVGLPINKLRNIILQNFNTDIFNLEEIEGKL